MRLFFFLSVILVGFATEQVGYSKEGELPVAQIIDSPLVQKLRTRKVIKKRISGLEKELAKLEKGFPSAPTPRADANDNEKEQFEEKRRTFEDAKEKRTALGRRIDEGEEQLREIDEVLANIVETCPTCALRALDQVLSVGVVADDVTDALDESGEMRKATTEGASAAKPLSVDASEGTKGTPKRRAAGTTRENDARQSKP